MRQVIYETKGRAREFNELAINLFTGCEHGCIYCYGADVTHQDKANFQNKVYPRICLDDVEQSAKMWANKGETRRILLCFVTDPYTPIEQETKFTRQTIEILHEHGLNVIILTKGGLRSTRDFDLLSPKDAYATTLTCFQDNWSKLYEPNAALPVERIAALMQAHEKGIETWVSLEPVIDPIQTVQLIRSTNLVVGHYKCGTMNYYALQTPINWHNYGFHLWVLLDSIGAKYYFKKDLLKAMNIKPEEFQQTWGCR